MGAVVVYINLKENQSVHNRLKKKWLKLYTIAQEISQYSPWDYFKESDGFTYLRRDGKKVFHFSFIGSTFNQRGIAVYKSNNDYVEAMNRLCKRNKRNEPVFLLQHALIALWSDRENISKPDYSLIKELELKFRGRGAWLHFNKYEIGYAPTQLGENEVDDMLEAFENLIMMVRATLEQGLTADFKKGERIVRWYSKEDKMYFTHKFKSNLPKEVAYPVLTLLESEGLREVREMPAKDYSVEIDWAYFDVIIKNRERNIVPLILYAVDSATGLVVYSDVLAPYEKVPNTVFNMFDGIIESCGKPKQIYVSDRKLEACLRDFCKKANIKFALKSSLPKADEARRYLEKQFII